MALIACRSCDGRKINVKKDEDGIVVSRKTCSKCYGTGTEQGPSKSGKRRFGPTQEKDEDEMTMEEKTRAFLRSKGF